MSDLLHITPESMVMFVELRESFIDGLRPLARCGTVSPLCARCRESFLGDGAEMAIVFPDDGRKGILFLHDRRRRSEGAKIDCYHLAMVEGDDEDLGEDHSEAIKRLAEIGVEVTW